MGNEMILKTSTMIMMLAIMVTAVSAAFVYKAYVIDQPLSSFEVSADTNFPSNSPASVPTNSSSSQSSKTTQPAVASPPASTGGCGCGGGGGSSGGSCGIAATASTPAPADTNVQNAQDVYIRALSSGTYEPQETTVKKGIPVRLHFTADANAGCGRQLVVYGLDSVRVTSIDEKEGIAVFTPQDAGTYEYNCGMRMWKPGKLVVQ